MSFLDTEKFIHENDIDTIEIGFADIHGILRGKSITARHFLKNIHQSFEFTNEPFLWDFSCESCEQIEEKKFSNGFSDIMVKPELQTLRKIPWRENTAFLLSEVKDIEGNPLETDPRQVLKKVINRINQLGYRPIIGVELEFYLLSQEKTSLFEDNQCYSLYRGGAYNDIIREMSRALEQQDIHIEAFHVEFGKSQFEVVTESGDALDVADQIILIKHTIKEVARKYGLLATFMPKPWSDQPGSAFHINQSLWDLNLKINYFEKDHDLAERYLAGLLTNIRELTALSAPSINAYKRFKVNTFAPIHVTAAEDNRMVAVRSLLDRASASRLEYRLGSAEANPYLIIAACIAAGINGLENKLYISKNGEGESYVKRAILVPLSLEEALNLLEGSRIAKEYFGEKFVKLYTLIGRREIEQYRQVVTEWERTRYMEVL